MTFIELLFSNFESISQNPESQVLSFFSLYRSQRESITLKDEYRYFVGFDKEVKEQAVFEIREFLLSKNFNLFELNNSFFYHRNLEGKDSVIVLVRKFVSFISFVFIGNPDLVTELKDLVSVKFPKKGVVVDIANTSSVNGKYIPNRVFINDNDICEIKPSFYPNLVLSVEEYQRKFIESNQNILILLGPPGTGKSKFLKNMIVKRGLKSFVIQNSEVFKTSNAIDYCNDEIYDIIIIEDNDVILDKRARGNLNMSNLLNISDGVASSGKKIVFSTNLEDVSSIDEAILRPGRCFDVLHFDHLNREQAAEVLKDLNKENFDLSEKEYWTLAELFNERNSYSTRKIDVSSTRKRIGF